MFGRERMLCFVYGLRKMVLISRPRKSGSRRRIPSIRAGEIALALNVVETGEARLPRRRPRLRQLTETIQDGDAFLVQCRRHSREIRKVRAHRIQPDGAARQKAAGASGIGVFEDPFELVVRGPA